MLYLLIGFVLGVVFTFVIIILYTLRQMRGGGPGDGHSEY